MATRSFFPLTILLTTTSFLSLFKISLPTVLADQIIYSDSALSNGWQDWSWGSTIDYGATSPAEGTSSISVNSTAFAALSLKSPGTIGEFAGLWFDISVSFTHFFSRWSPTCLIIFWGSDACFFSGFQRAINLRSNSTFKVQPTTPNRRQFRSRP